MYKFNIEESFVLNADTIFNIDLHALEKFHDKNLADISIALRYVSEADRFGSVVLNKHSRIIHFGEKNITGASLINGGVYIVKASSFVAYHDKAIFSFENDFIKHELEDLKVYGCQFKNYFIDIGIPDDFKRAELGVENFKFNL